MRQSAPKMENTQPRIVTTKDLNVRSYITFYFNGKRIRAYNGLYLGLNIEPNRANDLKTRTQLLKRLEYEYTKALENKAYPANQQSVNVPISPTTPEKTTAEYLKEAIDSKLRAKLNRRYKENLKAIYSQFTKFLTADELNSSIDKLEVLRIEEFLQQFNSSGTYYMNKRRDLGVLISSVNKRLKNKLTIVKETDRMKVKPTLHKIYQPDQLKDVLGYLKDNHPNLHLCCLICYGCFLRPHQEIRKLRVYHFKNDYTEIHLSGDENKGSKIRIVYVPEYVREVVKGVAECCKSTDSIFTKSNGVPNEYYFSTAWTRMFTEMLKLGFVEKNQTIYSLRHTAAVQVYNKTKDLNILQQLLGHSDMIVTLKYLRGLGAIKNEELRSVMPSLDHY